MTTTTPKTLPDLPEHYGSIHDDGYWLSNKKGPLGYSHIPAGWRSKQVFTAEQMHEYALAALAAQPPAAPLKPLTELCEELGLHPLCGQQNGKCEPQAGLTLTGEPQPSAQPPAVAAIPEGWKLVPIELDDQIRNVLIDRFDRASRGAVFLFTDVWADLLAAAPQPPAGRQDRGEAKPYGLDDFFAEAKAKNLTVHDILPRLKVRLAEIEGTSATSGEATAAQREKRCEYCDGTGDVHRADGEWLGACTCPLGAPSPAAPGNGEGKS